MRLPGQEMQITIRLPELQLFLHLPLLYLLQTASQTSDDRVTFLNNMIVVWVFSLRSPFCTSQTCCDFHIVHFAVCSGNRRGSSHASCSDSALETAFEFGGACIMINNKRSWEHFCKAFQSIVSPMEYN